MNFQLHTILSPPLGPLLTFKTDTDIPVCMASGEVIKVRATVEELAGRSTNVEELILAKLSE